MSADPSPPAPQNSAAEPAGCLGSIWRFFLWGSLALLLLLVGAGIGLWWAATTEPEAYLRVLKSPNPAAARSIAQKLESQATVLASDVKKLGRWQAIFTQNEVNAWLETILPEEFADDIPEEICDPRVVFLPGRVTAYCRYQDSRINSVVSLEIEAFLTDKKNEVAFRLRAAKAGTLPVPISQVIEHLQEAARHTDVPIKWSEEGGDPVALVQLQPIDREGGRPVRVHKLEVREGEIYFAGETVKK